MIVSTWKIPLAVLNGRVYHHNMLGCEGKLREKHTIWRILIELRNVSSTNPISNEGEFVENEDWERETMDDGKA